MKLEIKKADRTDLMDILEFTYEKPPVLDRWLLDFFDEVLSQTGYSLLLAKAGGKLVGTLAVSVINGIGKAYPTAVLSGGKLSEFAKENGVGDALLERARAIAQQSGAVLRNAAISCQQSAGSD